MSRTAVFLLMILAAAIVVETAYQLATGGFMGGEAGRYPTAAAFAREAGLAPKPAPRPPVAKPPVAAPPSSAPAASDMPESSAAPVATAGPVKAAIRPAAKKLRPTHRTPPQAPAKPAPTADATAPPPAASTQAPITAPY